MLSCRDTGRGSDSGKPRPRKNPRLQDKPLPEAHVMGNNIRCRHLLPTVRSFASASIDNEQRHFQPFGCTDDVRRWLPFNGQEHLGILIILPD